MVGAQHCCAPTGWIMNFFGKKVLFLGAHPDDIEIGCGALIHHIVQRTDILCVTLSDNQKNPDLSNVKNEHFRSMRVLGVSEEKIVLGPFQTRVFPNARQEILEYFLKFRKDFQPDLIFTHSKQDVHQDHNTMTDEALRAFRGITVLGFDVVRSSHGFFPHFLVEVTEEDVNRALDMSQNGLDTMNRTILKVVPESFGLDLEIGIKNPVGMSGKKLEVRSHIISIGSNVLANIKK